MTCQAGTVQEDSFHDAVIATSSTTDAQGLESESTTIVLVGFTRGDWSSGGGGGSGSGDFAALALDSDGGELWRWQVTCFLNATYVLDFCFVATNQRPCG